MNPIVTNIAMRLCETAPACLLEILLEALIKTWNHYIKEFRLPFSSINLAELKRETVSRNEGKSTEESTSDIPLPASVQYDNKTKNATINAEESCIPQLDEQMFFNYFCGNMDDKNLGQFLRRNDEQSQHVLACNSMQLNVVLSESDLNEALDKCAEENISDTQIVLGDADGQHKQATKTSESDSKVATCSDNIKGRQSEMPLLNKRLKPYFVMGENHAETSENTQCLHEYYPKNTQNTLRDLKYEYKTFWEVTHIQPKENSKISDNVIKRRSCDVSRKAFSTSSVNASNFHNNASYQYKVNSLLDNEVILARSNTTLSEEYSRTDVKCKDPTFHLSEGQKCEITSALDIDTSGYFVSNIKRLANEDKRRKFNKSTEKGMTHITNAVSRKGDEKISLDGINSEEKQGKPQPVNTDIQSMNNIMTSIGVDRIFLKQPNVPPDYVHSVKTSCCSDIQLNFRETREVSTSRISAGDALEKVHGSDPTEELGSEEIKENGTEQEVHQDSHTIIYGHRSECVEIGTITNSINMLIESKSKRKSVKDLKPKKCCQIKARSNRSERENMHGTDSAKELGTDSAEELGSEEIKENEIKQEISQNAEMVMYGPCPEYTESGTIAESVDMLIESESTVKDLESKKCYQNETHRNAKSTEIILSKYSELSIKQLRPVRNRVTFTDDNRIFSYNPEESIFESFYYMNSKIECSSQSYDDRHEIAPVIPDGEEKAETAINEEDEKEVGDAAEYVNLGFIDVPFYNDCFPDFEQELSTDDVGANYNDTEKLLTSVKHSKSTGFSDLPQKLSKLSRQAGANMTRWVMYRLPRKRISMKKLKSGIRKKQVSDENKATGNSRDVSET